MEANTQIFVTAAKAQDEPVLWLMLTFAAWMGSGGEEQIAHARSDPNLSTYVAEWGTKRGDLGVVARDGFGEVLGQHGYVWVALRDRTSWETSRGLNSQRPSCRKLVIEEWEQL
jgi:hypothetical protein